MSDTPTRQEYERAQEAGGAARRAGRPLAVRPDFGHTRKAATLRDAWVTGWERVDQQRARK